MPPMTEGQRFFTFLCVAAFVGMGLCPPWCRTHATQHPGNYGTVQIVVPAVIKEAAPYNWIWEGKDQIDYPRLFLQWGLLLTVYLAWYFWPTLKETPPAIMTDPATPLQLPE